MKPDEEQLLTEFARRGGSIVNGAALRDIGEELGIHPKRVEYLAEKWCDKGWYEYGVVCDLGWLLPKGSIAAGVEPDSRWKGTGLHPDDSASPSNPNPSPPRDEGKD